MLPEDRVNLGAILIVDPGFFFGEVPGAFEVGAGPQSAES
jgi:hypothetical protein